MLVALCVATFSLHLISILEHSFHETFGRLADIMQHFTRFAPTASAKGSQGGWNIRSRTNDLTMSHVLPASWSSFVPVEPWRHDGCSPCPSSPKTHHSDCDPWSREVKPSSQRAPLWFHRGKDLLCYEFIALVMLKQPSLCPSELSIWYLAPADPIFQWHCGKLFKISLIFCLKLVAETAACQEKQRAGSKTKSWRLFPCNNLSTICASQMSVLHPTITATSPWGSFTWPFVGDPCGGALVGALSAAKASATLVAEHITCKGSSPQNLQVLLKAAKHKRSACQKTLCMHTNNRYIGELVPCVTWGTFQKIRFWNLLGLQCHQGNRRATANLKREARKTMRHKIIQKHKYSLEDAVQTNPLLNS